VIPSKKKEKKNKEIRVEESPNLTQDPEDEEIERLERLLGVKAKGGSKKKAAEKLNKEYEMYEVSNEISSCHFSLEPL
jgi:hypothetical protein